MTLHYTFEYFQRVLVSPYLFCNVIRATICEVYDSAWKNNKNLGSSRQLAWLHRHFEHIPGVLGYIFVTSIEQTVSRVSGPHYQQT